MNINKSIIKNIHKPIFLALCVFLASCSSNDTDYNSEQGIVSDESSMSPNQSPQASRQRQEENASNNQVQVSSQRRITDIEVPTVDTSKIIFTPMKEDVMEALVNILVATAVQIPQSEERDAWYVGEINKIENMQVKNCTPAPLGSPSKCIINIQGQEGEVSLLFTQSGWQLLQ